MNKLSCILFGSILLVAPGVFAGAGHNHGSHAHASRYGGVVQASGELEIELVVKADTLTLYVLDHDKPLLTAGAKGEATVHAGGARTTVALAPAGDNKLAAQGSFKTGVGVRVAVVVSLPDKREAKLNFRLK